MTDAAVKSQDVWEALAAAQAENIKLRTELAQEREWKREANRLYRSINGMEIDDFDKRAEFIMQTVLDGLSIGPTNRHMVKSLLAEHFVDISKTEAAKR